MIKPGTREVHIVGGHHPDWPFEYFERMIGAIHAARPETQIKAFTAAEIDYFWRRWKIEPREALTPAQEGGPPLHARAAAPRSSPSASASCSTTPARPTPTAGCEIHGIAHSLGHQDQRDDALRSHRDAWPSASSTSLRLREQQDKSRRLPHLHPARPTRSGRPKLVPRQTPPTDDLRTIAVSRLLLDNFPHIEAYWVMIGEATASVALHFGASDVNGTLEDEKIAHMAQAESPAGLAQEQILRMIRDAGKVAGRARRALQRRQGLELGHAGRDPRQGRGRQAARPRRRALAPDRGAAPRPRRAGPGGALPRASRRSRSRFVIDSNPNYTNVCVTDCQFCAFYRKPGDPEAYTLTVDEVMAEGRVGAAQQGATTVLLQGGHNPALPLDYYLSLVRETRRRFPGVTPHFFTASEIQTMAEVAGKLDARSCWLASRRRARRRCPAAAPRCCPSACASASSPRRAGRGAWLDVHREAHRQGFSSTATMMYGHVETTGGHPRPPRRDPRAPGRVRRLHRLRAVVLQARQHAAREVDQALQGAERVSPDARRLAPLPRQLPAHPGVVVLRGQAGGTDRAALGGHSAGAASIRSWPPSRSPSSCSSPSIGWW